MCFGVVRRGILTICDACRQDDAAKPSAMAGSVFGLHDHVEKVQTRLRAVPHVAPGLDHDALPTECILDSVAQHPSRRSVPGSHP